MAPEFQNRYQLYLNAISSLGPSAAAGAAKHQQVVAKIREVARQCNATHSDKIQRMLCVIKGNRALKGTFTYAQ